MAIARLCEVIIATLRTPGASRHALVRTPTPGPSDGRELIDERVPVGCDLEARRCRRTTCRTRLELSYCLLQLGYQRIRGEGVASKRAMVSSRLLMGTLPCQ